MKTFNDFINESKIKLYHGDNFGLKEVNGNYSRMNSGNNQEGIGIYFSTDKNVADSYGKFIYEITIDNTKLLKSRESWKKQLSINYLEKLLKELLKTDNKGELWYLFTDYGYDIDNNKDAIKYCVQVANDMCDNEVRNIQIELCNQVGVEVFVKAWLKTIPYIGTYNKENKFYAIMKE